jgi:hypothetical protein
MNHPSQQLFERVRQFGSLPPEVASIPHQLEGISFFPAGAGLFIDKPAAGLPGFPSARSWCWGMTGARPGTSNTMPRDTPSASTRRGSTCCRSWTGWGSIATKVFYTNFYVGLRNSMDGDGTTSCATQCRLPAALPGLPLEQIELQKPRLVLVLGIHVPRLIAPLSADLGGWSRLVSFRVSTLKDCRGSPREAARIRAHLRCPVLVHPSYRGRNAPYRRYRGFLGRRGRGNLVQDMLATSSAHAMPFAAEARSGAVRDQLTRIR